VSIENLDTLLVQGCNWLNRYLINSSQTLEKLITCETPSRVVAAVPTLIIDSQKLAKAGRIDEAILGFTTAKQWNLRLTFDPVIRAKKLAAEAKTQK
jgi:hypothetical protein